MKDELSILTYGAAKAAGGGGGTGDGDMKKSVYDTDNDGVVDAADNAFKVGGHTVATDVPANAVFTDTVYDDTSITNRVTAIEEVIPEGATSSNQLATQSDLPSAVTGNPEGSATAGNLTKLQIGSDIYDVPSGGGGSSDPYDGRKTRYTISSSNWSSSPNSEGYYTYSLTLTKALSTNTSPNVYIAGASDSTQPTATESTMFSYVKRCNLSSTTTLVLYASTKPTSTFYVFVGAEGGGAEIYASTETVIGTWMGKTLYRKCYEINATGNTPLISADGDYTITSDTYTPQYVTKISAVALYSSDSGATKGLFNIPYVSRRDATQQMGLQLTTTGYIYIVMGANALSVYGLKVVIEYTKS